MRDLIIEQRRWTYNSASWRHLGLLAAMALAKISFPPRRPIGLASKRAGWVMSSFWSYSTRQ